MTSLINKKQIILLLSILFTQLSFANHHHHMQDPPSVHGMLLFGQEKIYLSHLPMFHNPHDYQVLFEVEIPVQVKDQYQKSLQNDPSETVYTIVPETFVLPQIAKHPQPFKAQLFKGHFERGGTPMTNAIEFKINKVLYFKKFAAQAVKPQLSSYIIIGNEKEQFLLHTVVAKPDFDYVTQINIQDLNTKKEIANSDFIVVEINSPNDQPLQVGSDFVSIPENNQAKEIKVNISKSIYLEFGDLSF